MEPQKRDLNKSDTADQTIGPFSSHRPPIRFSLASRSSNSYISPQVQKKRSPPAKGFHSRGPMSDQGLVTPTRTKVPARKSTPLAALMNQPPVNEHLWGSNGEKYVSPALWKPFRGTLPKCGDAEWNRYSWPEYVVLEDREQIDQILKRFAHPTSSRRIAKHHVKRFARNFDSEGYAVDSNLTAGLGWDSLPLKHEDIPRLREAHAQLEGLQEESEDEEYKAFIIAGFKQPLQDSDLTERKEAVKTETTDEEPIASDTPLEAQYQKREDSASTAMSFDSTSLPETALEYQGQQREEDRDTTIFVDHPPVPETAPETQAMQQLPATPSMMQVPSKVGKRLPEDVDLRDETKRVRTEVDTQGAAIQQQLNSASKLRDEVYKQKLGDQSAQSFSPNEVEILQLMDKRLKDLGQQHVKQLRTGVDLRGETIEQQSDTIAKLNDELDAYKQKLRDQTAHNITVEKSFENLKRENAATDKRLKDMEREQADKLQAEVSERDATISQQSDKIRHFKDRSETYYRALADAREVNRSRADYDRLQQDNARMSGRLEDLEREKTATEQELKDDVRQYNAAMENKLKELEYEKMVMERKLKQEFEGLQQEHASMANRLEGVQREKTGMEERLKVLVDGDVAKTKALEGLKMEKAFIRSRLEDLGREKKDIERRMKSWRALAEAHHKKRPQEQEQYRAMSEALKSCQESAAAMEMRLKDLEREKTSMDEELKRHRENDTAMEQRLADLKREKTATDDKLKSHQEGDASKDKRLKDLERERAALRDELQRQTAFERLREDNAAMDQELKERLRQDIAAMDQRIKDLEREKSAMEKQLTSHHESNAAKDKRIADLEQEKTASREKRLKTQKALEVLQRDNASMDKKLKDLEREKMAIEKKLKCQKDFKTPQRNHTTPTDSRLEDLERDKAALREELEGYKEGEAPKKKALAALLYAWDQICRQLDDEKEEQDEFLNDVEAEVGTKEFRELLAMGEKLYDMRLKICI